MSRSYTAVVLRGRNIPGYSTTTVVVMRYTKFYCTETRQAENKGTKLGKRVATDGAEGT